MGKSARAVGIVTPAAAVMTKLAQAAFIVDRLGELKAAKATLEMQEKAAKRELVALVGTDTAIEGKAYRAAIAHVTREGWDKVLSGKADELVARHLSPQFISAHTTRTEFDRVDVSARNADVDVAAVLAGGGLQS
jgi:hypothetical protein